MNGHQYALDVSGEWVDATRTEYVKHSRFFCDCPARHRMKLVKPSGSFGKRRFCDYFAHSVKRIKLNDGTSTPLPTCASGGESELHRKAKHVLREMVGGYSFATFRCSQCWVEEDEDTRGCSVAIEVRSEDGRWRYDCLLKRGEEAVAALEVVHTHLVGEEKAKAVRASGLQIAEFRAQDVMDMVEKKVTHLENLQIREGLCSVCLLNRSLQWITDCYNEERHELVKQDAAQFCNYMHADKFRQYIERVDTLGRILEERDVVKRCKLLLALGLQNGVKLRLPEIGTVTCSATVEWEHGLLGSGFNPPLPTAQICIVVLQDGVDVRSLGLRWRYERRFYIFINCETILKKLSTVVEESLCLLDCRPPKQFQRHMGRLPRPKRQVGTCDSWYGGVFAARW